MKSSTNLGFAQDQILDLLELAALNVRFTACVIGTLELLAGSRLSQPITRLKMSSETCRGIQLVNEAVINDGVVMEIYPVDGGCLEWCGVVGSGRELLIVLKFEL